MWARVLHHELLYRLGSFERVAPVPHATPSHASKPFVRSMQLHLNVPGYYGRCRREDGATELPLFRGSAIGLVFAKCITFSLSSRGGLRYTLVSGWATSALTRWPGIEGVRRLRHAAQ